MSIYQTYEDKQIVPLWIDGRDVSVAVDRLFEVVNASENSIVHYAHAADVSDVKAAIGAASAAFVDWSKTPISERREILIKASQLLNERAEELGMMQARETSSMPFFGAKMAQSGASTILEIAAQMTTACAGVVPTNDNEKSNIAVVRQAVGPVLFICPWNSPTYLGPRGIGSALAAGCTVVLKGSEQCPQTFRMICQLFEDAGLPAGVLNLITTTRDKAGLITETIIADPRIRKVEFIGSATVGSIIGQLCGKYLKPILMELGGKCPAIVCHDADLKKAAKATCFGAFLHHGQICMSTERVIVVKEAAQEFINELKKETPNWSIMAGSAATKEFADKAHDMLEEACENGAEYIIGDNSYQGEHKTSLAPTFVTGIKPDHKLFDHESFGPSASLFIAENEEEALKIANDSQYGLTGAIWTKDVFRGLGLAKRLECGVVSVNDGTLIQDIPATMFGGATKGSGWGTANAAAGIQEFLILKAIVMKSG